MTMSSGYYIVFLVAIVASVAAMQQQLWPAFIAFCVAIIVFWLSKRKRKGHD